MTDFLLNYSWIVPIYSLVGALITLPWSLGIIRKTGPRPAAYINILMTVIAFVHGSIIFNLVWTKTSSTICFPLARGSRFRPDSINRIISSKFWRSRASYGY